MRGIYASINFHPGSSKSCKEAGFDRWRTRARKNWCNTQMKIHPSKKVVGAREMLTQTKTVIVETGNIEQVKRLCPNRQWSTVNRFDFVGTRKD